MRCPHPRVEIKDRTCWDCGGKFHLAKDCPQKARAGKPLRLLEDGGLHAALQRLAVVSDAADDRAPRATATTSRSSRASTDSEGFTHAKKTFKPTPSLATIGDFMHGNSFAALSQRERKEARREAHADIDENNHEDGGIKDGQ